MSGKDGKEGKKGEGHLANNVINLAAPKDSTIASRVELKRWNAVALWSWEVEIDNCAICRNSIMEPCIECQAGQAANIEAECTVAWGVCNHAFHLHCITKWLKNKDTCPLDNVQWEFQKYGDRKKA